MTVRVCVYGAAGRMGRSIISVLLEDDAARIVSAVDCSDCPVLGLDAAILSGSTRKIDVLLTDRLSDALADAQVVIDFTLPQAILPLLTACIDKAVPAVIGTTGLDDKSQQE